MLSSLYNNYIKLDCNWTYTINICIENNTLQLQFFDTIKAIVSKVFNKNF